MWSFPGTEYLKANWLPGLTSFCMETLPLVFREKTHTRKLCNIMVPSVLKMNYFCIVCFLVVPRQLKTLQLALVLFCIWTGSTGESPYGFISSKEPQNLPMWCDEAFSHKASRNFAPAQLLGRKENGWSLFIASSLSWSGLWWVFRTTLFKTVFFPLNSKFHFFPESVLYFFLREWWHGYTNLQI